MNFKRGINTEAETNETVEHDVVLISEDGRMAEVTENDPEVR